MAAAARTPQEEDRMSETAPSSAAIGNLATLADGQVLLPRFVLERQDGLYVDLSMLDSGREFIQFGSFPDESDSNRENNDEGLRFRAFLTLKISDIAYYANGLSNFARTTCVVKSVRLSCYLL